MSIDLPRRVPENFWSDGADTATDDTFYEGYIFRQVQGEKEMTIEKRIELLLQILMMVEDSGERSSIEDEVKEKALKKLDRALEDL